MGAENPTMNGPRGTLPFGAAYAGIIQRAAFAGQLPRVVQLCSSAKNMKTFLTAVALLISFPFVVASGAGWTYQAEEGEDATSTHYYFFESNGESVQRVRWVWNGGAQNPPTVTEYLLGSGKITIRHLVGKREDIPSLVAGLDAELEVKKEYSILAKSTAEMLLSTPPAKELSDTRRIDLKNLIDLLAKERKPTKPKAQQGAASDGDKPPN
jgi:hypothetical protein